MNCTASIDDLEFLKKFESFDIGPDDFSHPAHVRVAYALLATRDDDEACDAMRSTLHDYLRHHGVPETKYHETLTKAWMLAVRHFMERTVSARSFGEFFALYPQLGDSSIMLTHYRKETLFSDAARAGFVTPDLEPIG